MPKSGNLIIINLLFLMISGCISTSPTYTSDGKLGYTVDCSGMGRNWGMCYQKAGELCGTKGYKILTKSNEQSTMTAINEYTGFSTTTYNRTMVITCKTTHAKNK